MQFSSSAARHGRSLKPLARLVAIASLAVCGAATAKLLDLSPSHSCMLLNDGRPACWGANGTGQQPGGVLFPGGEPQAYPIAPQGGPFLVAVAAGGTFQQTQSGFTGGLAGDGTLYWWGIPFGQQVPVAQLMNPATATLDAGYQHLCFSDNGSVRCVGTNNDVGQQGPEPGQSVPLPGAAVQVSVGGDHSCALLSGGEVFCWGANASGQLGNGTDQDSAEPVRVVDIGPAIEVSAGDSHSCAALASGAVACWGAASAGQLGDGSRGDASGRRLRPVQLDIDASTISTGTAHSCAITVSGAVLCWGAGSSYALGTGDNADRLQPTTVISDWVGQVREVRAAESHSCALVADALYCWGSGYSGQLGLHGANTATTPRRVPISPQPFPLPAMEFTAEFGVQSTFSIPESSIYGTPLHLTSAIGLPWPVWTGPTSFVLRPTDGPIGVFPAMLMIDDGLWTVFHQVNVRVIAPLPASLGCPSVLSDGFEPGEPIVAPTDPLQDSASPGGALTVAVDRSASDRFEVRFEDPCGRQHMLEATDIDSASIAAVVPFFLRPDDGYSSAATMDVRLLNNGIPVGSQDDLAISDLPTPSGVPVGDVSLLVLDLMVEVTDRAIAEWATADSATNAEYPELAEVELQLEQMRASMMALRPLLASLASGAISTIDVDLVDGGTLQITYADLQLLDRVLYAYFSDRSSASKGITALDDVRRYFTTEFLQSRADSVRKAARRVRTVAIIAAGVAALATSSAVVVPAAAIAAATFAAPLAIAVSMESLGRIINDGSAPVAEFDATIGIVTDMIEDASTTLAPLRQRLRNTVLGNIGSLARRAAERVSTARTVVRNAFEQIQLEGLPTIGCNELQQAGNNQPFEAALDLGTGQNRSVVVSWSFQTLPDQLDLGGGSVFSTGCTGGSSSATVPISDSIRHLRVKLTPNCNGTTGTAWEFSIDCR